MGYSATQIGILVGLLAGTFHTFNLQSGSALTYHVLHCINVVSFVNVPFRSGKMHVHLNALRFLAHSLVIFMLRLLYFRTELTMPSGIRITVLQKLSGCDDEINLDLTQPSVPMKVFHLSAQDSVHYAVIYSA